MNDPENPMLPSFGSEPADIAKGLREFSRSAETLSNNQLRFANDHPSKWIGVYRGQVLSAKADDLSSLMAELERQGIPLGDTIVRFIEENQRTLIL